ncbi:MAG: methylmalonyl Co-A mutase-associated GTPase MeaB [Planctomycetes bacterium]|nr:methylmalonyl Co-A mutase-associated GTPase MeaB [Planctomycetota bacterium]
MELVERVLAGDQWAISKAISAVENGGPEGRAIMKAVFPHVGGAVRIGITGPPGVGKSTLCDAITGVLRPAGRRVGIISVDPSSAFTGGALLGDRIRMGRVAEDPEVFMRSMATRGAFGGLSRATQDAADLLDAAGCQTLLIETVGVGQSEIEVARAADCVGVVLSPESGDGIQAMKSGLMEIADLVVINKADRVGADKLEYDIRSAFELGLKSRRETPILLTEAHRSKGVPELVGAIDQFVAACRADGRFEARRRCNMESRLRQIAEFMIHHSLFEVNGASRRVEALAQRVLERRQSSYDAAEELVREALDPNRGANS